MKYNLTIKDNETGEVVRNIDTNAIVGAVGTGKGTAQGIYVTECTLLETAGVAMVAMRAVDVAVEKNEHLKLIMAMCSIEDERWEEKGDPR